MPASFFTAAAERKHRLELIARAMCAYISIYTLHTIDICRIYEYIVGTISKYSLSISYTHSFLKFAAPSSNPSEFIYIVRLCRDQMYTDSISRIH